MSETAMSYETFVLRNAGYILPETQSKIRSARVLIAGCGIGSSPAICAARMGFEHFVLVDGDTVEPHNLNRQFYEFADIGKPKVEALKDKILRINPQAQVEAVQAYLDADNTENIVSRSDIIFDTIDFLDLPAILRLHTVAKAQQAHIFTALSVGFGALVWYFPPDSALSLADILAPDVADARGVSDGAPSYAAVFSRFIQRLTPYLDTDVVEQITKVLTLMSEGKPCPASQVAVGSFAIGAMAMSMMQDVLAGHPVPAAPKLIMHSFKRHETQIIDVSVAASE